MIALFIAAAIATGGEVTIRPLAGDSRQAELVALSATQVTFRAGGTETVLPAEGLMAVDFPARDALPKPTVWVELLDGSKLGGLGYSASAGKANLQLTTGDSVELPARSIRFVRFREQDAALAAQWREIVSGPATGDLVVIRKTSMRTAEDEEQAPVTEVALDQLDGTIVEVTPESVRFEFDGEKIDVRREKLEGIVYFQPTKREFSAAACRVVDAGGSVWAISAVDGSPAELEAGRLRLKTVGGVEATLKLSSIAKVDYSAGNIAFLAELEPDTGGGAPAVSLQPAGMAFKFGSVFAMRARPPLGATAFQIDGQRFDSGLSLHSPASLVYRVPEGFRRLRATAGVDDSVVAPGDFNLVIAGDGKELLRQAFGPESRGPMAIDLDLAGVRRVTITLDPADGQDIGDQLNLCEARLTK